MRKEYLLKRILKTFLYRTVLTGNTPTLLHKNGTFSTISADSPTVRINAFQALVRLPVSAYWIIHFFLLSMKAIVNISHSLPFFFFYVSFLRPSMCLGHNKQERTLVKAWVLLNLDRIGVLALQHPCVPRIRQPSRDRQVKKVERR